MKSLLAILLSTVVSGAVVNPRQAPKAAAAPAAGYQITTKTLQPQVRSNSQRTITRVGPFKLLPGLSGRHGISLDSNGQGFFPMIPAGTFCGGECTVISGKAGLEFEDGTPADVSKGVYNHHVISVNSAKKIDPFVSQCDYNASPQALSAIKAPKGTTARFVGVSDDNGNEPIRYGTKDGVIEGGYWISKGEGFSAMVDLVNLDKQEKIVYLTYDLEFLPGHHGTDAQGSLISVTGCAARKIAASPTAPSNTTSHYFKFFRSGTLINGKGHLHDGGVAMDLHINNKYACSSNAVYGGESGTNVKDGKKWETISAMTLCPGPFKIKAGDYMNLTSRYDLTQHPLRENGDHKMAEIMGMYVTQ